MVKPSENQQASKPVDRIHIGQPPGLRGEHWRADLESKWQSCMHPHARGKPSTVMRVERGAGPGNFEPLATVESMRKGQLFLRSKEADRCLGV